MTRTRIAFLVLAAVLLGGGQVFAILGIEGDLGGNEVFDRSNYETALDQLFQLQRQSSQLFETYAVVRGQLDHLIRMARRVPVEMAARYRAVETSWGMSDTRNTFGTTGRWIEAINHAIDVADGYADAVVPLNAYGAAWEKVPADQRARIQTDYATVELADGANLHTIDTVGRLRANAALVEAAIRDLEDDSLSSEPEMNTEIAVLNKINAANVIAIRGVQDTNKLLVTLAEQQVLDAKRRRDAEAEAIDHHIRFMAEGDAILQSQGAGVSQAMRDWRMP